VRSDCIDHDRLLPGTVASRT